MATGAAQQVHIMPGKLSTPPRAEERVLPEPSRRTSRSRGTDDSMVAASSRPSTMACQIARKYARA